MQPDEIYQELIDYIFEYCLKYYSELEIKAKRHHFGMAKFGKYPDNTFEAIENAKGRFFTEDQEVKKLLENGYSEFMKNTATRIYKVHKDELNLNVCPKCEKIARTPSAKQCRFCFYTWH